ncbi:MAG: lipopolysaccharide heptosyltransferase RfaC [Arsenophonus sp.]|nr:MAG: lipopolysaccharide heptosyltransferase RfaC [Arsenophonus sp.]
MKILIVKISSMGDILHTLPSLTDASSIISNISFDWVIEEDFVLIPKWHSSVNKVIPVSIRRWKKKWFSKKVIKERHIFYSQLKQIQYDSIIDAQGLLKSTLLITRHANGIKHGYDWKSSKELFVSLFYNFSYFIDKNQHAIERTRLLFAKSLKYKKPNSNPKFNIMKHFLNLFKFNYHACSKKSYIIIFHATTSIDKHWPVKHWNKLIYLLSNYNLDVKIPWYSQEEYQQAKKISFGLNNTEILSKLSLNDIAKYIIESKAVVSVDTGLSHLTSALKKLNIILYGPTDPKLIGCFGKNQIRIVSKNNQMSSIKPEKVFNKLLKNLII